MLFHIYFIFLDKRGLSSEKIKLRITRTLLDILEVNSLEVNSTAKYHKNLTKDYYGSRLNNKMS